mgnify:CR=1
VEAETPDVIKTRSENLLEWLLSMPLSISGLYPGCPPQRETFCLELIDQALIVLCQEKSIGNVDKIKKTNKNKNNKSDDIGEEC